MTIETMRSFEYETDTEIDYGEQLLRDRVRQAHELGIISIGLAEANRAYSQCIADIIKTNEALGRIGLKGEAESRIRAQAGPHELMISAE